MSLADRFRLLLALALWLVAAPLLAATTLDRVDLIDTLWQAEPPTDAAWQRHALPLRWTTSSEELRGRWLRLSFALPQLPREVWSMLLPRLPTGGVIRLNGHVVAEVPQDSHGTQVRWHRPQLLPLPPEFLRLGHNEILIHTRFRSGVYGLAPVEVGASDELTRRYTRDYFVNHTLRWVASLLVILVALGFTALWWRRRNDTVYGLLGLAAGAWALRNADFAFEAVPHAMLGWTRSAYYVGTAGFVALASIAALRWSEWRCRWLEVLIVALAAIGPFNYWIGGESLELTIGAVWQGTLLVILSSTIGLGVVTALRRGTGLVKAIAVAVLLALIAAAHDYLVIIGLLPYDQLPLLNITVPILLFAVATALIDRFVTSLTDVERINHELESRIEERERLLKRNFERVRESERIKAGAHERQRIMQDMHDGLGSQLLSSLMLVERGAITKEEVAQVLRESIDDMRLAIDTLATEDADLLAALGNLRFRMDPRLKASGIELQWDARNLPVELEIVSDAVLPILRVVQEALTNAIKHSHASIVRVTLAVEHDELTQWLAIRVADNGRGLPPESTRGRGLANMRTRAGRIGATFSVDSLASGGTVVALRYRLEPVPRGPSTRALQLSIGD
ncbi:MAG: ATP-binding protein [Burkholderiaceae bacterium]